MVHSASLDTFATARLVAERLTPEHLPDVCAMDRDEDFMTMLGGVRDEPASRAYVDWNLEHWASHGFGLWMLRDRESRAFAGRAIVRRLDAEGTDEVELGYGLLPAYWGRGLATEVARACIAIGRERLALSSMVAITRPEHLASRRVMEKAGLRYERDIIHAGLRHVLYRTRFS